MTYEKKYLVKNISINNINKRIKNHILEHKKKFKRFKFDCQIDGMVDKYCKNKTMNLYVTFCSEKEDLTHNYYLKFPKPMIETKMLKILDRNPTLIKSLGAFLVPNLLLDLINCKNWGYISNKNELVHDYNWYESDPKYPSPEILDLMRPYLIYYSCQKSFLSTL